ncbi:hypothetical protein GCM10009790_24120 [Georgenia ruanii]|uniref:FtsK/SpoIIIE domain-containing protein n=1 Tax=Georgenia ruanii TaxID=348442 RepID=UPI0031E2D92F
MGGDPHDGGDPAGREGLAAAALRAAWHLAVVAGPDTGWCLPLAPGPATVGRGTAGLTDPAVSRRHLEARTRGGRVQVRDAGSANGTRWRAPGRLRRPRRLGRRWRAVPAGTRLAVGGTVLEVRPRPTRLALADLQAGDDRVPVDLLRVAMPVLMCLGLAPLLASSGAGGWRWALLALPAGALLLTVLEARRRSRRAPSESPGSGARVPGRGTWGAGRRAGAGRTGPDPASLLLLAAAGPVTAEGGEVLRVAVAGTRRRWPEPGPPLGRRRRRQVPTIELAGGDRVALVGPAARVLGAGRWVVAQLLVRHGAAMSCSLPPDWPFAGHPAGGRRHDAPARAGPWHLDVRAPAAGPARSRVSSAAAPSPPPTATEPGGGPPPAPPTARHAVLVLAERLEQVPTWCTRVVPLPAEAVTVTAAWLAAVTAVLAPTAGTGLPAGVPLAGLLGDLERLERRWAAPPPGLAAVVGVDRAGPVELDLAAEGPHALVAGTTGAGKSDLLLAWLLGLAVRHSPGDLQLVLVDYKGGATFDVLAALPHTAGVLTDLDPAATTRALASLRAEVRRRERVLAGAGARDLAAYRAAAGNATPDSIAPDSIAPGGAARGIAALPRLLVVVDEFRALADTHPAALSDLVRLASQGRSLGIHLVLATQRPAGAVTPEIRANLTARVCLRVLDAADSLDVLAVPDAARLPALPGRALLRTAALREIQVPWVGADGALAATVVAAARSAWRRAGHGTAPARPWAEPLPAALALTDLPLPTAGDSGAGTAATGSAAADSAAADPAPAALAFPLARTDLPAEQRLGVWTWDGATLLVTGGPRTGRTEALRAVVAQALRAGVEVHVLAAAPERFADLRGPALGTVVGAEDPRRAARLLRLLASGRPGAAVLVVDDADVVADRLDLTGPGRGVAALGGLVRGAGRVGLAVALSGPPSMATVRWVEAVRTRLVLAPRDETEALLAGVPAALRSPHAGAGRGVLLAPGAATVVQLARAAPVRLAGAPVPGVPRLAPLPTGVASADLPAADGHEVAVGLAVDDGGPVRVACGPGARVLVVGPPGSGRTTALATARDQLRRAGRTAAAPMLPGALPRADALVLDDVDGWPPGALDEAAPALHAYPGAVLAAAGVDAVVAAYRGPLATWRGGATLLVLRPAAIPVAQLTAADVAAAADPARPFHPGRGALVERGVVVPVQVARVSSGEPAQGRNEGVPVWEA